MSINTTHVWRLGSPPRQAADLLRRRTRRLLVAATAVGSMGLATGGVAGVLLGVQLTGSEAAAGLPLGLLVVGTAVAALLISAGTDRLGRSRSLALGYLLGALGAVVVIIAAMIGSLGVFLAGSTALGAANAAIFLTRYAAAEVTGRSSRGGAIGAVLFATAFGAVASPALLGPSGDLVQRLGMPPLTGLYVVALLAFGLAALLLALAATPGVPWLGDGAALLGPGTRSHRVRPDLAAALRSPHARIAVAILAVTNLVMVGVMAMAPVHLAGHGHGLELVGLIVGVHAAGMFAPAPLSGWAADRAGARPVAIVGMLLLLGAGLAGALVDQHSALAMTLVLAGLGIGWNFGVVGGSSMLATAVPAAQRPAAEGLGEVAMSLGAVVGAPGAGVVVALAGFSTIAVLGAVVATVGLMLVSLAFRR